MRDTFDETQTSNAGEQCVKGFALNAKGLITFITATMIRKPLTNFQQQLRSRSSVISPLLKEEPKIQNVCRDIRGVLDEHLLQKSSLLNPISKYYFDGKVRRLSRPSFDKLRQLRVELQHLRNIVQKCAKSTLVSLLEKKQSKTLTSVLVIITGKSTSSSPDLGHVGGRQQPSGNQLQGAGKEAI